MFVEGNTDALMAHQQGFENVVGTLGTALTAAQIELVTRYAPRIAMAYDVDAAGQGAATFGATELSALVGEIERSAHKGRLTDVGVVRLPDGRDPDEVMREEPDAWRNAADNPQPIVEYLIDNYAKRYDPRSLAGREKLVSAVMPTIRRVTNPTQRDGYLQLLARRSGVEERVLLEELKRPERVQGQRPAGGHARRGKDQPRGSPLKSGCSRPGVGRPAHPPRGVRPAPAAAPAAVPAHSARLRLTAKSRSSS